MTLEVLALNPPTRPSSGFMFSNILYTGEKQTPSAGTTSDAGTPTAVPPGRSGRASARIHKAALIGGILAGLIATGALLVVLLRRRRQIRRRARRSQFSDTNSANWTSYAMNIRARTLPHDATLDGTSAAVSPREQHGRDPTPFDAFIASQSKAPDEAKKSNPQEGSMKAPPKVYKGENAYGQPVQGTSALRVASRDRSIARCNGNCVDSIHGLGVEHSPALYANSSARRERISASAVWLYYLDSSFGDAELVLSYLERIILQTYVRSLHSLPYEGCVRKVQIADGLNADLAMALTIRAVPWGMGTHISASAQVFTFTSIEFSRASASSTANTSTAAPASTAGSILDKTPIPEPPPAPGQGTSSHSNIAAVIGGALGGAAALAGILVLIIALKRRRSGRSATRSPTDTAAPSDWIQYATHVRNAILPSSGAHGLPFIPVSTRDLDETAAVSDRGAVSPQTLPRGTPDPDVSTQHNDWGQLIWNEEKRRSQSETTGHESSSGSGAHYASGLRMAPTTSSAGPVVRWEEPPPQYTT
ncbi:hypothetical protein AURDEDRAFT_129717 [Auricularia subglabra TFB-10046 SS5]|uniref:Uncharacterized protein n=1 Tax=Auricularia subglabra (strain TFB-10046 / SS5) TaxID=717982 RepID=J0WTS3_AURST|nr:hypothetical protein AURDEDRAFT_129717 [Auricularia subglabra TFB-10046 SS5]